MPKYFLLLTGDGDYATQSQEENQKTYASFMAWSKSLAESGCLLDAARLEYDCRILQPGPGPVVMDGPFAESKETIGGYFAITAANLDKAAELAAGCPHLKHGGFIQVRGVMEMPVEAQAECDKV